MIAIRFPGIEDCIMQKRSYMSNKKIGNITSTFGDIYSQKWCHALSEIIIWYGAK